MTLKPDAHWKPHDTLHAGVHFNPGHKFVDRTYPNEVIEYVVEEELSAVSGSEGLSLIAINSTTQRKEFLKLRKRIHGETFEQTLKRANHEFNMSRLLKRIVADPEQRRGPSMCADDAVCAKSIFIDDVDGYIITVFPYKENFSDLFTFLRTHFYKTWNNTPNNKEAEEERAIYQLEILHLCKWLFGVIHRLNSLGVYHGDIKSENILVQWNYAENIPVPQVTSMRLIDFGMACGTGLDPLLLNLLNLEIASKKIDRDFLDSIACYSVAGEPRKYFYSGGRLYRDPKAGDANGTTPPTRSKYLFTAEQLKVKFPRFEAYACSLAGEEIGGGKDETEDRMPAGLREMLEELQSSGPRDLARVAVRCGIMIQIIEEEHKFEHSESSSTGED
jgi:serine/threonine protein kinase